VKRQPIPDTLRYRTSTEEWSHRAATASITALELQLSQHLFCDEAFTIRRALQAVLNHSLLKVVQARAITSTRFPGRRLLAV